MESTDHENHD